MEKVILGKEITIEEFMAVARFHSQVEFSQEYEERVKKSREIIEVCVEQEKPVYGTTTGFGALVSKFISKEEAELLQKNIILTHAVSVGEPMEEEEVRAVMLMELQQAEQSHIQDALSLRCVPQLHGAAKRILQDAWDVVTCEINSCGDNPVVYGTKSQPEIYSNGNPDASYVGMQMDAACIAAANLAKMSERRNARFLDEHLSGLPWFLAKESGLNSGLMIPQYAQAGLLNTMRMLAMPATVVSVSTSAGQEDYVSMGYNACQKARMSVEKLEYILAIEVFSAYQTQQFIEGERKRGQGTAGVYEKMGNLIPVMEKRYVSVPASGKIKRLDTSGRTAEDRGRHSGKAGVENQ